MACNTLNQGISKGCKGAGGLVEVYIGNYPTGYTSYTSWVDETDGTISAISGLTSSMYTFDPAKNTSSWSDEINVSNTSIGYNHMVNLIFGKNEADKRNTIKLLGEGNLVVIVRDMNEKYFLLGHQNGVEITEGSFTSGAEVNAENGWNITISGMQNVPAFEVQSSVISDLLA